MIGEDGSERPPRIYTPGMDEDASSPRLPQLRVASRDPRGPIANRALPCLMTMRLVGANTGGESYPGSCLQRMTSW